MKKVITTRSYDDRLETIDAVREAGISVCSGGILGLGETHDDRVGLIWEVSKSVHSLSSQTPLLNALNAHSMPEHPESFPVNALVPIKGTPLENNKVISSVAAPEIVLKLFTYSAFRPSYNSAYHLYCSYCASHHNYSLSRRPSNIYRVRTSHVFPGWCQCYLYWRADVDYTL